MVIISLAWLLYSLFLRDYYILLPNIFGFGLGIFYTLSTFRYSSAESQSRTIKTLIAFCNFIFVGTGVAFISLDYNMGQTVLGSICLIVLIVFYSSPLTSIYNVVKTKNTASIDRPMAWATYYLLI